MTLFSKAISMRKRELVSTFLCTTINQNTWRKLASFD